MHLFLAVSLAAILVIGVLAVTSVLLFSRQSKGNAPQPTTRPISITLSNCTSLPGATLPVLVDLCTHHQFKDLLQWRKIGNYVLVLERAYLDLNQLVMTYRVFSQATGQQVLADLGSPRDTVITTSQGQSFTPSEGAWQAGGPQVVQFRAPSLPAQTRMLQLHVEVNALRITNLPLPGPGTAPAPQPPAVHGPVTFDFTLEYHGGLVVALQQTVTVKTLSVTLERVILSPSETIIEGTTTGAFPVSTSSDYYTFMLDAAGRSSGPSGIGLASDSPFRAVIEEGLLGQHGMWTFQISYDSGLEGPWVFHFRVP